MFEPELVKQIVSILENSSVEELELSWEGKRLVIKRSSLPKQESEEIKPKEEPISPPPVEVVAQSVGLFYPSVKEGEMVKEGEKIGEIETLGIRDEVLAPADGVVEKLLPEGEIVEYGKLICLIKPQEVKTS